MQSTVVTHPDGTTITTTTGGTPAESLVDCSRVFVKNDQYGGAGAFAAVPIKKGELVEKGIVRVLTNCDGNENPYVFTWSDEQPNTTWAIGSGCSTFYNTCSEATGNTHMEVRWLPLPFPRRRPLRLRRLTPPALPQRDFAGNSFVILATKDIAAGDELLHVYKSKKWRTCFQELNDA